ncbi:MAG: NTP transferase domain-containing protein [Lachnospiraceae bacterium]|nr:NTP transferase domain-containing protein [Lachnospiraceae bacterium]
MNTNLEKYLVTEDTSIVDTMKTINEGDNAIAFVCRDGRLVAAVTDGDIRRHLIAGGDMNRPVREVANYHPVCVRKGEQADFDALMREKVINAVPVVDERDVIVDIRFLSKRYLKKKHLSLPVVIMAGGMGTRLKPYTEILPKPLIPIGSRTITEHIMARFQEFGCSHFDMIINYKKNFIKSYFQDNELQYDLSFVEEPEFWGTAGGLKLIEGRYAGTVFVSNCDILVQADYADILETHKKQHNLITMVCAKKNLTIPYGTVETDEEGQVTGLREKPVYSLQTNTGLYLIEPAFLTHIPESTRIDITEVIENCVRAGERVGTYVVDEENWLDMGQLEEMERMKRVIQVE